VVTLLILAYNEEKYIERTISKYINDFQKIIIVDDKSKDGTLNKVYRTFISTQEYTYY
jgi:glycosyltransferase involved in cell wall biosynthesis